jgi:hypothetical protein
MSGKDPEASPERRDRLPEGQKKRCPEVRRGLDFHVFYELRFVGRHGRRRRHLDGAQLDDQYGREFFGVGRFDILKRSVGFQDDHAARPGGKDRDLVHSDARPARLAHSAQNEKETENGEGKPGKVPIHIRAPLA